MSRPARALEVLVVLGIVAAAAAVVRNVQATRAPRRALGGSGPVIGSLDTWPPVPRAPHVPPRGGTASPAE